MRGRPAVAGLVGLVLVAGCGGGGEPEADPFHFDETTFIGTVTEHHPYDVYKLQVDKADVTLDLIGPVGGGCYALEDSLRDQAQAAKEAALPVGTRVLVVRADESGPSAFVHLLPADSDEPDPAAPAASVNEQLVSGGSWEPSGFQLADDDSASTDLFAIRYPEQLSEVQARYAPLLVAAGNAAKSARTAGQGACLQESERQEAEAEARRQQYERESEEAERRRQREGSGGGGYCRDGDGDGICFED
ncbi:hypothetical protein [Blastococcus sp. LR1]|uniref:hypothetical protein n=1 Tax=Blastococcus sp. LR1 TaxID=2877000 RepID=UPI001CCA908A|nr:hypothetical protein [Blastococcus sp. LR1]MCA0144853.1 hypothetical protein [Blastococcus sp. LR1]